MLVNDKADNNLGLDYLNKATIIPVSSDTLAYYVPFVVSYIQDALEHTDQVTSVKHILSDIANQKKQLWIIKHNDQYLACAVTQIHNNAEGCPHIGEISYAGGSKHYLWDHFPDVVGQWFKEQGCSQIQIAGRVGWERKYRNKGFKRKYVILRKDL